MTRTAPTRIYAKPVLALAEALTIKGMSHITGGGLTENLPRMFAATDLAALIDLDAWSRPAVFDWLQQAGNVDEKEMLRTFNCGVGMVVAVPAESAGTAVELLKSHGERAWVIGHVVEGEPAVELV